MRKRFILIPALALVALTVFSGTALAQEDGYPFRLSNFSLEFLGGYSKLNPPDFNRLADYEEAYVQYYYVTRFNYYRALYGEGYQAKVVRTGDARFNPVTGAGIYGFRLRYDLSPSLGLSFGVQYLDRQQHSSVGMDVDVLDTGRDYIDYNGPRGYAYQNSGFLLAVSTWEPQVAAHFGWQVGPVLRFELLVGGGPLFVSVRSLSERRISTTDPSGYVSSSLSRVEMSGKSTGFSGALGGRICVKTGGFLNLFVEGSYAFRIADEISGPGSSRTVAYDSNASQDPALVSWAGGWINVRNQTTSAWGQLAMYVPQNQIVPPAFNGPGAVKFNLDLSGFQVKAGLAIRF
jgi:hypothetical protein